MLNNLAISSVIVISIAIIGDVRLTCAVETRAK